MARRPAGESSSGGRAATRARATFPRPEPGELEDVDLALTAGASLWESGDEEEALKWLRRAAGTAADRDADGRALVLFKAAADIASELEARRRARESGGQAETAAPSSRGSVPSGPPSARSSGPSSSRGSGLPRARGSESSIVPPVPPATAVREAPRRRSSLGFEEGEEDTFIRPETMLRRALLAIDPGYAERTDYTSDDGRRATSRSSAPPTRSGSFGDERQRSGGSGSFADAERERSGRHGSAPSETDPEADTERRTSDPAASGTIPGALPAVRVAVLEIPEERDVRLLFLPAHAEAPAGVVVATLVPATDEDARRLAEIYARTAAKL